MVVEQLNLGLVVALLVLLLTLLGYRYVFPPAPPRPNPPGAGARGVVRNTVRGVKGMGRATDGAEPGGEGEQGIEEEPEPGGGDYEEEEGTPPTLVISITSQPAIFAVRRRIKLYTFLNRLPKALK